MGKSVNIEITNVINLFCFVAVRQGVEVVYSFDHRVCGIALELGEVAETRDSNSHFCSTQRDLLVTVSVNWPVG